MTVSAVTIAERYIHERRKEETVGEFEINGKDNVIVKRIKLTKNCT